MTTRSNSTQDTEDRALIRELVDALAIFANARVDTFAGTVVLGNVGAPAAVKNAKRVLLKAKAQQ